MYRVMDRNGRLVEVEDGQPCPDGCRLAVDAMFLDGLNATQRQVFADSAAEHEDEDQAEATDDGISDEDADRISYWLRRNRRGSVADTEALRRRADQAYYAARDALGKRNKRYANIGSFDPPEHQKRQPTRPGVSGGKSGPWKRDAQSLEALRDKAADAYDARSRRLQDAWKKNKGVVANGTPAGATSAAWVK